MHYVLLRALAISWVFVPTSASALVLPDRPTTYVNDYADALTPQEEAALNQKFAQFERQTTHQAAVAIFPSLDGEPVEDVTTLLFEKWKLGDAKRNDGILLVIATQSRDLRIEVGYGLEGQLPDALAGRIIREEMVPQLREGRMAHAILAFEQSLEGIFVPNSPQRTRGQSFSPGGKPLVFWFFIILFILFSFMGSSMRHRGRTLGSRRHRSWNSWGSGSSWGGGWGGGGGGLSGGGGASGRW